MDSSSSSSFSSSYRGENSGEVGEKSAWRDSEGSREGFRVTFHSSNGLKRDPHYSSLFEMEEFVFLRRSRPLEYYPLKRRIKIWKCAFTRENNRGNDNGPENPERNARADGGCITSSRTTVNDIWQTFRERIRFNAEFDLHIFPFILDFILSRFV